MKNLFKKYNIAIVRKDIKNFILRVKNNFEVFLSIPLSASDEDIDNFLANKEDWIEKQLNRFNFTKGYKKIDIFCDGGEVRILGRQYKISVRLADKNNVYIYDNRLVVETNDIKNIKKQYNDYYIAESIKCFNERLDEQYKILKKYNIDKPVIKIKKMKNLWGSSSPKSKSILLNYYLYTAPISCINYVILHELAHFIHYNHNRDFYLFLSFYMPDWNARKRELDYNYSKYL